jgi:homoserine dehydrogenase
MENREVGIGILGLGNVGKGTLDILDKKKAFIEEEIKPFKIKLLGLADLDKTRKPKNKEQSSIFTTSAQQVIENPEIKIIVEAIGGEYPAFNLIRNALENGKHVVTPNKEVVAKHGYELLRIAKEKQVQFLFETSVGSAIPILGVISNILTSCPLDEISGILNGTTNYILDLMFEDNLTQQEALKKAQEKGYAEADPSKDILGVDALYKIFILSSLGFRARLELSKIDYCGISDITQEDVKLAKKLGYRIKLIASACKKDSYLNVQIQPSLVEQDDMLSKIQGADNGIRLYGESYGELFFSGAGAGGIAGGSMIVSDIVRIIRQPQYFGYDYLLEDFNELEIRKTGYPEKPYLIIIKKNKKQFNNVDNNKLKEVLERNKIRIENYTEVNNENKELVFGMMTSLVEEEKIKKALDEIKERVDSIKETKFIQVLKNLNN